VPSVLPTDDVWRRAPREPPASRARIRSSAMTTDTARWRKIREILETAIELPASERERFLEQACAGDATLRDEVESLLCHDARTGRVEPVAQHWMRELARAIDVVAPEPESTESGRRIGAYVLVREIGSGGMGKVYLAERDDRHFQKRVAIKLIKRGMDTDDILRRFKQERQVLANLEHANIARLLDGGATGDGLPYLVLEHVDGVPIDRWCDEHRATVRERIELFLAACSAVHYAHQNLVVHRDLKPSNILVTRDGVPKLLDFGIAKVLDADGGERTLTEQRVMTPAYASPEQLRGEAITTSSDVYSLGLILCELLAGKTPFKESRRDPSTARIVRLEKPSTLVGASVDARTVADARRVDAESLRRLLAGDLDTIVLAALQEDPARRYASVDHLAADLRRYLAGEPVSARPDSLGYRASKFVKRNKLLVGAAAALLLALAVGFTTSTILYFSAVRAKEAENAKSALAESRLHDAELAQAAERAQRELAEKRFEDVRKLATTFIFDVHYAIEALPGSLGARQLIVKTATDYLERLAGEKRDDPQLKRELAEAWLRIGDIQGARGRASFGQTEAALRSYEKALAIANELVAADPVGVATNLLSVEVRMSIVDMLLSLHRIPEAREICEQVVAIDDRFAVEQPDVRAFQRERARAHDRLGEVLTSLGDDAGALEHYRLVVTLNEALVRDWPGDDELQCCLGNALQRVGVTLASRMQLDESLVMQRRALEIFERVVTRDPTRVTARREVGACRNLIARVYLQSGCAAEACRESRASVDEFLAISQGDPLNWSALADTASALVQHASCLIGANEFEDAVRYGRAGIGCLDDILARDPDNLDVRHNLAVAQTHLATALVAGGRHAEGLSALQSAREELEAAAAAEPSDTRVQVDLCLTYAEIGTTYVALADVHGTERDPRVCSLQQARAWLRRSIDGLRRMDSRGELPRDAESRLAGFEASLRACDAALAAMGADAEPSGERAIASSGK
jgi:serine/threonine protein kinase